MCGGESRVLQISARSSGCSSCVQLQIIAHEISSPPQRKKVFRANPLASPRSAQQQWRIEAIHEVVAVFEVVIEEEDRLVSVEEVEVGLISQPKVSGRWPAHKKLTAKMTDLRVNRQRRISTTKLWPS